MFKGATLFGFVFALIAKPSREFILGLVTSTSEMLDANAPMSYIALAVLLAPLLASVLLIKLWPERADPANPMARYRGDRSLD
jgi:hypothetical protein